MNVEQYYRVLEAAQYENWGKVNNLLFEHEASMPQMQILFDLAIRFCSSMNVLKMLKTKGTYLNVIPHDFNYFTKVTSLDIILDRPNDSGLTPVMRIEIYGENFKPHLNHLKILIADKNFKPGKNVTEKKYRPNPLPPMLDALIAMDFVKIQELVKDPIYDQFKDFLFETCVWGNLPTEYAKLFVTDNTHFKVRSIPTSIKKFKKYVELVNLTNIEYGDNGCGLLQWLGSNEETFDGHFDLVNNIQKSRGHMYTPRVQLPSLKVKKGVIAKNISMSNDICALFNFREDIFGSSFDHSDSDDKQLLFNYVIGFGTNDNVFMLFDGTGVFIHKDFIRPDVEYFKNCLEWIIDETSPLCLDQTKKLLEDCLELGYMDHADHVKSLLNNWETRKNEKLDALAEFNKIHVVRNKIDKKKTKTYILPSVQAPTESVTTSDSVKEVTKQVDIPTEDKKVDTVKSAVNATDARKAALNTLVTESTRHKLDTTVQSYCDSIIKATTFSPRHELSTVEMLQKQQKVIQDVKQDATNKFNINFTYALDHKMTLSWLIEQIAAIVGGVSMNLDLSFDSE